MWSLRLWSTKKIKQQSIVGKALEIDNRLVVVKIWEKEMYWVINNKLANASDIGYFTPSLIQDTLMDWVWLFTTPKHLCGIRMLRSTVLSEVSTKRKLKAFWLYYFDISLLFIFNPDTCLLIPTISQSKLHFFVLWSLAFSKIFRRECIKGWVSRKRIHRQRFVCRSIGNQLNSKGDREAGLGRERNWTAVQYWEK